MLEEFYQNIQASEDWRILRSEGYLGDLQVRHPDGRNISVADLPPLLRTLLITDGTVTKVLEAFFWEPVNVRALHLNVTRTEKPICWLNLKPGTEVLTRQVQLIGEHTANLYAEAFSVVNLNGFDPALRDALIEGRVGLGVLLRELGLETYREIMAVGMEYGPQPHNQAEEHIRVYRTYRITQEKQPVILIRESFPWFIYSPASG